MKIPAIRVRQWDREFYLTTLPLTFFRRENSRLRVDLFRADTKEGYQRRPAEYRAREFARFLYSGRGMSPEVIVLNVREASPRFEPIRRDGDLGYLLLPDEADLWLVDGQHRIDGIRNCMESCYCHRADLEASEMGVAIIHEESQAEEARQYLIINKTQKGIRSDLAERLVSMASIGDASRAEEILPRETARDMAWRPKAAEIVEVLNTSDTGEYEGNPWLRRIRLPNEPRGQALVSQKAFEDSLRPVLTHELLKPYDDGELGTILVRYWRAIESVCPEAFRAPDDHVVQRTIGVHVFHNLLPRVASLAGRNGRLKEEGFREVLALLDGKIEAQYWSRGGTAGVLGASRKSIAILVRELSEPLKTAELQTASAKPYPL